MAVEYIELKEVSQLREGDVCRAWNQDGSKLERVGRVVERPGCCFTIHYDDFYAPNGSRERTYSSSYLNDVCAIRSDDVNNKIVLVGARVKKRLEDFFALKVPQVIE